MRLKHLILIAYAWIAVSCRELNLTQGGSGEKRSQNQAGATYNPLNPSLPTGTNPQQSSGVPQAIAWEPQGEAMKQRISFVGSRGDQVPGYLWGPKNVGTQRLPAVLLMYGINDDKDSGTIGQAAEYLATQGFISMTIDWPGIGERGSISTQDRIINPDIKEWTVNDYAKAIDFLQGQAYVDSQRMAYLGASMGAMTGIVFAKRDARMKALIAIVPIPNPLWGTDDPMQAIRTLNQPVQCISTSNNSDFSGTVCANIGARGEAQKINADHELSGFETQIATMAKDFLLRNLK